MIIHLSESRGTADHGWLTSRHTFSFAEYYNPDRMNFGALRVLNDDSVAPGMGFGTHPHRDMEIVSITLEGSLAHKDSEGNMSTIKKGEVQIMSAGTGIHHSEFNASKIDPVKFLQIWILPKRLGVKPRYEQKDYKLLSSPNKLVLVASPDGRDGSLTINQDAFFSLLHLNRDQNFDYKIMKDGNGLYVFILKGALSINQKGFKARDGIGLVDFEETKVTATEDAEILLMEVPMRL